MGAEDAVLGHGRLAPRVDDHAPSGAAGLLAQPRLDAAFRRVGDSGDHSPVDLLDLAIGEQPTEPAQCLWVAAQHQAAGGVAVEPVGEGGRVRQAEAQQRKPVLQMRTATRPGMDRDPGRLVDDQYQPVAVQHALDQLVRPHSLNLQRPPARCIAPACPRLRLGLPRPLAGEGRGGG